MTFPFTGSIEWEKPAGSRSPVSAIHIQDNVGTIAVEGRSIPAVLAFYQPGLKGQPGALGGIFATAGDNAFVITTVHNERGQVTWMVFDSFTQTHNEKFSPTGSGSFVEKSMVAKPIFAPFAGPPRDRRAFPGLAIEGPNITVSENAGTMKLGRNVYEVSICGAEDYREGTAGQVESTQPSARRTIRRSSPACSR